MTTLQNIRFYYGRQHFRIPVKTALVQLSVRTSLYVSADFEGQQLWAECSAFETNWYESETWPQVYQQLKFYKTKLEHIEIDGQWYTQLSHLLTLNHARDTIDYLMWQAFALQQQQTLPQLLSKTTQINCGITVSTNNLQDFQQLLPDIQHYPRVKLKWHKDIIDFIKLLPIDMMIAIDANGQLTDKDFTALEQLANYSIAYIEEPFKKRATYQKFKESGIALPIAIDESANSLTAIQSFVEEQLVDSVCLKHGRLGGLSAIRQLSQQINIPCFAGGMYEVNHAQHVTALVQSMLITPYPADLVRHYFFESVPVNSPGKYNLNQQVVVNEDSLFSL